MAKHSTTDWDAIRRRAGTYGDGAFDFVREGLAHTVQTLHGVDEADDPNQAQPTEKSRHVSGRQLCLGLRDLALQRYGLLAPTVLRRWGVRKTDDFGVIVYAMIDRGEMKCSEDDRFEDFRDVYDFHEAFAPERGHARVAQLNAAAVNGKSRARA